MQTNRRDVLKLVAAAGATTMLAGMPARATTSTRGREAIARRRIPSTGELVPMIGLGTARTFNVDPGTGLDPLVPVMEEFLAAGGTVIDSSPMYGRAESVVGALLEHVDRHDVFFATKVWTAEGRDAGIAQMEQSIERMQAPVMDLMQVHNLVAWETHLPILREWKEAGRLRYLGITEMRDFELVERLMRDEDLDFIQIPYSISDRRVEERVLPAAADTGTAVLVMTPFGAGRLFRAVRGRDVPEWAAEIDCTSWAQFFLKFVLAHPAVTCPIPATSSVEHLVDNMQAGVGRVPDDATRERMAEELA